jgi:hypothetical protein
MEEKRKCQICGNDAKGKGRLCSKHFSQYSRQRESEGRSLQEFIDFHKIPLPEDTKNLPKITAENAEEQKLIGQAMKERQHAQRLEMENARKMGDLVSKSENTKATVTIVRGILEQIENGLDSWPMEMENKSAGEVKAVMVKKVEQINKAVLEFLKDV